MASISSSLLVCSCKCQIGNILPDDESRSRLYFPPLFYFTSNLIWIWKAALQLFHLGLFWVSWKPVGFLWWWLYFSGYQPSDFTVRMLGLLQLLLLKTLLVPKQVSLLSVCPSWLGSRSTVSMLCCGVTVIKGLAHCLPLQKISAACGYHCTQSQMCHPWCYTRDGDAMVLPPVLSCLGMPQNQGGIADSIHGSWAAGLFWIAGRFMANTRSTFSGLWLSESVALLSVCKSQSVERQVNAISSR